MTTTTRAHDLPPRWDGYAVVWEPWEPEIPSTLRLHVDDGGACPRCGSLAPTLHARGTTQHDIAPLRLYVSRCSDCRHDVVLDADNVAWDLEPADYTDAGSVPPDTPAPGPAPAKPGRALPAEPTRCGFCGAEVVWAITVAGPNGRGGKRQPLDPREDLAGNVAVIAPRRGRLLARALMADEHHDPPGEYLAMPHAATCTPEDRWT